MQATIQPLPEVRYAYICHTGPYNEIKPAFGELLAWAGRQRIDFAAAEIFCLSYDDPETVPAAELRSRACIAAPQIGQIDDLAAAAGQVKFDARPAGRYAVHAHKGSYDGIKDAFRRLAAWAQESGEAFAAAPFVEIYRNDCNALPEAEWLTDLCIPLKEPGQ